MTNVKISVDELKSIMKGTEELISKQEHITIEITQFEQQREHTGGNNEYRLWDL